MTPTPVRTPSEEEIRRAHLTEFQAWLKQHRGLEFGNYEALWGWSVHDLEGFWDAVRLFFDVPMHGTWPCVLDAPQMMRARWFPGAQLNYAEQIFRHRSSERPALIAGGEDGHLDAIICRTRRGNVLRGGGCLFCFLS